MSTLQIVGIKCDNKFFVSKLTGSSYRSYESIANLLINGKKPELTFHKDWVVTDNEPETVQRWVNQPNINHRYELIDETMASERIPLVLTSDEATEKIDGEIIWKDEFSQFRSLYKAVSDKQDPVLENIPFTYETRLAVTEIREYEGFAYNVQKTKYENDGTIKLTEASIKHNLLDQIIFPNILLPARPCFLSQEDSYRIVRQYIKQHINFEVATITSDYDFCFTVKKRIPLAEVQEYTVDVNAFTKKRRPKYEKRLRSEREVEIFNMAPKPYQKYRVIQGFQAENQEALKEKIDAYCEDLIAFINEPVSDCPNCKGLGVLLKAKDD